MRKKSLHSKWKIIFIIVLIIIIVFLLYKIIFDNTIKRWKFLRQQTNNLQKELNYLKEENTKLKKSANTESNEEYLEKESRLSLGMQKEGETVVVLEQTTTSTTTKPEQNILNTNINKIIDFFKNWFH